MDCGRLRRYRQLLCAAPGQRPDIRVGQAAFADYELLDTLGSFRYVMATGSYRPLVDLDRARLPDAKVDVLAVSMARIDALPDAIRDHLSASGLHGT